jgi:hypothetical protein
MTDTVPDMNELRTEVIQSLKYFSQIYKIKVKDNEFIQQKINYQRVEFQNFAEGSISHSLKMCSNAEDLVVYFDDDNYNKDGLLESLRPSLSDIENCKSDASSLKEQLEGVRNSLHEIVKEYDAKIIEKRESLPNKIDEANKVTDGACSYVLMAAGIGSIAAAAVAIAPFTTGTSLAMVPVAGATFGLSTLAYLRGYFF